MAYNQDILKNNTGLKMKINLTKKQYGCLIKVLETAGSIYGILGDLSSEHYKKQNGEIEALQKYLLTFAHDFGVDEITETYKGRD